MIKPTRFVILIGLFFPVFGTGLDILLSDQPLKETGLAFLLVFSMPPFFLLTIPAAVIAFNLLKKSSPGVIGKIRRNERVHLKPCIRFLVSLII